MREVARRWEGLAHPLFVAALATLVVNDHLLKSAFPGWWTGKASDAAGVLVAGVGAAVLLGTTRGLLLSALGFTALKTVPGVAEALSPVFGGVTARDHSDLIALLALPPAWWLLSHRRAPVSAALNRGVAASTVVPLIGAVVALFACTATSCAPRPAVVRIVASGRAVFAEIDRGYYDTAWARSDDGGESWTRSTPPPSTPVRSADPENRDDAAPRGPLSVCTTERACFRLHDQRVIERTDANGTTTREFVLSDHDVGALSTECVAQHRGVLTSVAVGGTRNGDVVVASLGADGVVVRRADGHWDRRPVADVHLAGARISRTAIALEIAFGLALPLAIWAIGRRRWPSWRRAVWIAPAGSSVTLALALLFTADRGPLGGSSAIALPMVLGNAVTLATAIVIARSTQFAPKPAPLPT